MDSQSEGLEEEIKRVYAWIDERGIEEELYDHKGNIRCNDMFASIYIGALRKIDVDKSLGQYKSTKQKLQIEFPKPLILIFKEKIESALTSDSDFLNAVLTRQEHDQTYRYHVNNSETLKQYFETDCLNVTNLVELDAMTKKMRAFGATMKSVPKKRGSKRFKLQWEGFRQELDLMRVNIKTKGMGLHRAAAHVCPSRVMYDDDGSLRPQSAQENLKSLVKLYNARFKVIDNSGV